MRGPNNADDTNLRNIISFGKYHDEMTQPVLTQIRAYWEELRAGRLMPLRSEVDPREMSPFLETCFVLERVSSGDVRFRLAGMAINELMAMEVRGMPLRALIAPVDRPMFSAKLAAVFVTPEIQEYRLESDQPHAPELSAVLLVMPLKDENGEVNRAIGCMTTKGTLGIAPRRFRVKELKRTSLLTGLTEGDPLVSMGVAPLTTAPMSAPQTGAPATSGFSEHGIAYKHRPTAKMADKSGADNGGTSAGKGAGKGTSEVKTAQKKRASEKAHASYLRVIK